MTAVSHSCLDFVSHNLKCILHRLYNWFIDQVGNVLWVLPTLFFSAFL